MESFFNIFDNVISSYRRVELQDQIPVIDLKKTKRQYKSRFVKWETTVSEEHVPDIEKLITAENNKLLRQLEKAFASQVTDSYQNMKR